MKQRGSVSLGPSLGLGGPLRGAIAAGVLVVIVTACVFGSIAAAVMHGYAITRVDVAIAQWFHQNATTALTGFVLAFTHLHSTPGLLTLSALFALFLLRTRQQRWLLTLAITVPGGMLLNVALKHIFQRARPTFDEPLLSLTTYSFPSGHASGSTVFYGLLAAYLICMSPSWMSRIVIALAAMVMVALVAISRMYLGVHYLSDVVAGMVEGIGWLALVFTAVAALRQRRSG
jgi:undecaprenyl-diphosphatase